MGAFHFEIDESSIAHLKGLIGTKSQLIYADRFIREFGVSDIEASFFVLAAENKSAVKISSNWIECEATLEHYCVLTATLAEFTIEEYPSIFSYKNQSAYSDVMLLSRKTFEADETVFHDFGILVQRADQKRICLVGGESAFRNIVLIDNARRIASFLNDKNVQLRSLAD